MVDMKMGAEHIVDFVVSDAERKQLVPPALLARKIERRRMTLVLAGAGVDQDGVARRPNHKGLIGDDYHAQRRVEHLRLHRRQMLLEDRLVIGRKEVLRPPPWAFAFNHRVDGDVANPELFHFFLLPELPVHRNGQLPSVQAEDDFWLYRCNQRNLLSSAISVSRSFGSSGASVSFVIASALGAAFSAIC